MRFLPLASDGKKYERRGISLFPKETTTQCSEQVAGQKIKSHARIEAILNIKRSSHKKSAGIIYISLTCRRLRCFWSSRPDTKQFRTPGEICDTNLLIVSTSTLIIFVAKNLPLLIFQSRVPHNFVSHFSILLIRTDVNKHCESLLIIIFYFLFPSLIIRRGRRNRCNFSRCRSFKLISRMCRIDYLLEDRQLIDLIFVLCIGVSFHTVGKRGHPALLVRQRRMSQKSRWMCTFIAFANSFCKIKGKARIFSSEFSSHKRTVVFHKTAVNSLGRGKTHWNEDKRPVASWSNEKGST